MDIFSRVLSTNLRLTGIQGTLVAGLGIVASIIFLYTSYEGSFPTFTPGGFCSSFRSP